MFDKIISIFKTPQQHEQAHAHKHEAIYAHAYICGHTNTGITKP